MEREEINKRNEAIALFMGAKLKVPANTKYAPYYQFFKEDGLIYREKEPKDMKYNSSWDWLMPVVEKIEKTRINGSPLYCEIGKTYSYIYKTAHTMGEKRDILSIPGKTKIEAVFLGVSEFCMMYNENKLE
jgi:hypothetical protein